MSDACRLEMLLPHEIRAAWARRPVAYLPLGTVEWHSEHLPVGLDALTAHGLCLKAAELDGGLVYPPLFFGTGGGHGRYPFTVMMDDGTQIAALVVRALERLQDFGVRLAVLYSGHFAPTQLALIASLAESWNGRGGPMRVLARAVNQGVGISIPPDHAGVFETTLLHSLWPDRVKIDRLQPVDLWPDPDNGGDPFGPQRHDANHPLWGIFGSDPRKFDPANSAALLTELGTWLIAEVRDAEPPKPAASLHGEAAKVARSAAL